MRSTLTIADAVAGRMPERMTAGTYTASVAKLMREEDIHRKVVHYIKAAIVADVAWTHMPAGEDRSPIIGGKLKGLGTQPGWPDLQFLRQGRFYGLELKRIGGKVSPNQSAAHFDIIRSGSIVAVAYGYDAAIATLKGWGLVR